MSDLDSDNADDIDVMGMAKMSCGLRLWEKHANIKSINQSNHNEGFISLVGGRPG